MGPIRHNAQTHVGRVRSVNEDSVLALPDQRIWVVADGMGGHDAGDFASQMVVDAVAAVPVGLRAADQMQALRVALARAHGVIRAEAERRDTTIGATVVALMLSDAHFVAFWAGDSRLYRFRGGTIELLTTDHSVVADLVKAGAMTWDEVEALPQSNAITRAAGVGEILVLDKIHGDTRRGDRFLLCSDGLTKYARFEDLRRAVVGAPIETVSQKLVQMALDGGGGDNISVIVVDVT